MFGRKLGHLNQAFQDLVTSEVTTTSMCLVLSRKIGLRVMCKANWLSQWSVNGLRLVTPSSSSSLTVQVIGQIKECILWWNACCLDMKPNLSQRMVGEWGDHWHEEEFLSLKWMQGIWWYVVRLHNVALLKPSWTDWDAEQYMQDLVLYESKNWVYLSNFYNM